MTVLFCLFFSYQRQLEFTLLSISLQTTLLKVDMEPYGTLQLQLSECFIFHTSARSVVFIIHFVEGHAFTQKTGHFVHIQTI